MDAGVAELVELLRGRRFVALTGAGCSTESGIPDYRGPGTAARARNPIRYQEFLRQPLARARYWARSSVGWQRMSLAAPNAAHRALAELERAGLAVGLITQNVDRLHTRAGSRRVIELHGALDEVRCIECGTIEQRSRLQERLIAENPDFAAADVELAPDGDAELDAALAAGFRVAPCLACGGVLKPNVVFFGENVPAPTVEAAYALLSEAEVLLVLGSSLTVFSGFRFVRRASAEGVPVAIVNLGETRGDPYACVRVEARVGELLPEVAERLGGQRSLGQLGDAPGERAG
jgi:NAD-dependent SIR2 family protein deacetylase